METTTTSPRQSKYCLQIAAIINEIGHASNVQILQILQQRYPDVSATTVHRATARLASRGELGIAPNDLNGAMRYDANTQPHDHFLCASCGMLKDVDIADQVAKLLQQTIAGCGASGRITISGTCKQCSKRGAV